jgi:hypothetical protein
VVNYPNAKAVSFASKRYKETQRLYITFVSFFMTNKLICGLRTPKRFVKSNLTASKVSKIIRTFDAVLYVCLLLKADHLVGENGLINLLRQKGYTVEPVN